MINISSANMHIYAGDFLFTIFPSHLNDYQFRMKVDKSYFQFEGRF
jgi:hypothetical protein